MDEQNKAGLQENIASVNFMKKRIILKGVALIGTMGLLVVLAVVGTVGWYTRVSQVDAITMDVAEFDFTANYVNETFMINTADYTNINNYKVAPGSKGVIPIRLGTDSSDVDVEYELTIDTSATSPEMRRRIRYFYFEKDDDTNTPKVLQGTNVITGHIHNREDVTEYIYWEWVYDLNPSNYYYFGDANEASGWKTTNNLNEFYWNVVKMENLTSNGAIKADSLLDTLSGAAITAIDDFNELDTRIGLGKLDSSFISYKDGINRTGTSKTDRGGGIVFETYALSTTTIWSISTPGTIVTTTYTAIQQAMQATIKVKGVQSTPTTVTSGSVTKGMTKYIDPATL